MFLFFLNSRLLKSGISRNCIEAIWFMKNCNKLLIIHLDITPLTSPKYPQPRTNKHSNKIAAFAFLKTSPILKFI